MAAGAGSVGAVGAASVAVGLGQYSVVGDGLGAVTPGGAIASTERNARAATPIRAIAIAARVRVQKERLKRMEP